MRTPSPWRPPLSDVVIAAVLGLAMVGGTFGASRHMHAHRPMDGLGALIVLGIACSLAYRRRQPAVVLGAVSCLTLVYFLVGYGPGPVWLGLLLAYATAVVHGHRLTAGIAAVAGFLVFPWLDDWMGRGGAPDASGLTALAAGLLVLFGAAEAVRARRARVPRRPAGRRRNAPGRPPRSGCASPATSTTCWRTTFPSSASRPVSPCT